MLKFRILASVLAVATAAVPAKASISYYSSQSTFDTAITSLSAPQTVSFNGLVNTYFDSTSLSGFNFVGAGTNHAAGGELTVVSQPNGSWPAGAVLAHSINGTFSGSGETITITPETSARAIAFSVGFVNAFDTADVLVTTASGATSDFNHYFNTSAPAFDGVVADEAIASIIITVGSGFSEVALSSIEFADAGGGGGGGGGSGTPEPASLALLGLGMTGLALVGRRRK